MADPQSYLLDLAGVRTVIDEDGAELPATSVLEVTNGLAVEYDSINRRNIIGLAGTVSAPLVESNTAAANKAAIVAAITEINANGGGILELPAGTFDIAGPITPPTVPCVIRGAGIGVTVLDWDNVDNLFYKEDADPTTDHLTLEGFTIDGRWDFYQADTPNVAPIYLHNIDDLVIQNVEVRNVTWFGIRIRSCERALVQACKVFECGRDAISTATCTFVQVLGNQVDHCGDDAITNHVRFDEPESARHSFVCVGNRISDSKGITALGLRRGVISGNQLERIKGRAIQAAAIAPEYSAPHSVVIADNVITDVFETNTIAPELGGGCQYINIVALPQAGTGIAVPGLPQSGTGTFEPIDPALDNILSTEPQAPAHWILVANNECARTLPTGGLYSSLGNGEMFSHAGYFDFTITADTLGASTSRGLRVEGGLRDSAFRGNIVRGMRAAMLLDALSGGAKDFENIVIAGNQFIRCGEQGILSNTNVGGGKNIIVENNLFDGDPYHEHSNRGAGGTWAANGSPTAISINNGSGYIIRNNHLKRWCRISDAIAPAGSDKALWYDNTYDCDPSAVAFSTSNKGIGNIPRGFDQCLARVVDSDPTSATYGDTLNVCFRERDQIPTTGKYVAGHFVRNTNQANSNVFGWIRLTTGSGHTLGTDWAFVPMWTETPSSLTIATGAVTVAAANEAPIVAQAIDTEGAAATDDLDTLSGLRAGQIAILASVSNSRLVVAKDGTGNLKLTGDCVLFDTEQRLVVISDGTNCYEVARSVGVTPTTIRPAQITSNQNNYTPTGASSADILLLSTDASRDITGFVGSGIVGTTVIGRLVKFLINDGSFDIVLKHESSSSSSANRFTCDTGADIIVRPGSRAMLIRDTNSLRWRVFYSDVVTSVVSLTGASNTLAFAHANRDVRVSHTSASTLTVPANSTVPYPIGTLIPVTQTGVGTVEIIGAGGVTLDVGTWYIKATAQQNATVFLRKVATDQWELFGDLMLAVRSIRPAQITSNQNDYSPTNWQDAEIALLRTDASRDVTGFASPEPAGTNYTYHWRHIKQVINDGSTDLVLKNESASSTAANRITCEGGADITLTAGTRATLIYDNNASRWRAFPNFVLADSEALILARASGNVAIGADPASWNSMVRGLFIADATAVPTGNPTGGAYLYVEGTAIKIRFSDGSIRAL